MKGTAEKGEITEIYRIPSQVLPAEVNEEAWNPGGWGGPRGRGPFPGVKKSREVTKMSQNDEPCDVGG